jgi:hypothetical protein
VGGAIGSHCESRRVVSVEVEFEVEIEVREGKEEGG